MTSREKINKGISLFVDGLGELIKDIAKKIENTFNDVWPKINPFLERKYTKKKFKKMLQSYGIQRNKINEIIANNRETYTRKTLYKYVKYKDIKESRGK